MMFFDRFDWSGVVVKLNTAKNTYKTMMKSMIFGVAFLLDMLTEISSFIFIA